MKKSILAAAIAAAVAAPAVNANVTIYGKVHVSVDNIDGDMYNWPGEDGYRYDDSISDIDQWQVKSRASRIGFKGTEDLGNGLSLIWKAETTYDFADGSAWGSGRNAYIGLTGDWGTFLYGRHDTPYKMAYYAGGVEMMGDTIIDFGETGYLDSTYSRVRASNAIAYVSPNMNGLTIAAAIVPGEGNNFDNGTGLADAVSISGMYSNNGLKLAAGYEDLGDDDNKFLVTAGYTMNNFTIAALYQNADFEDQDIDTVLLAGSYSMGNNTFVAKWGRTKDSYEDGTRATVWSLGAEHKLSKRSSVYVGYTNADENYQDDSMDGFSVGMIHNF
ncbi:hypothetical protein BOW39_00065 [Solemya velum gill symbiont]|uniref:porin n=1 Tax=Solemya velum gill symbiont TaxID=2340 RepID=UPI0009C907A8|nr:porin [Solemya velum gill symbiont]OOZ51053.1 hypothetical protein BOW39_00065 [Solemya velum gill symbiont]